MLCYLFVSTPSLLDYMIFLPPNIKLWRWGYFLPNLLLSFTSLFYPINPCSFSIACNSFYYGLIITLSTKIIYTFYLWFWFWFLFLFSIHFTISSGQYLVSWSSCLQYVHIIHRFGQSHESLQLIFWPVIQINLIQWCK